jgi:uncharacterized protein YjbJ (UPF0337 family)
MTGLAGQRTKNGGVFMDKDRTKGLAKQIHGTAKEAIGKVTGNKKTEAEGAVENMAGKVQSDVGAAKDKIRNAVKK